MYRNDIGLSSFAMRDVCRLILFIPIIDYRKNQSPCRLQETVDETCKFYLGFTVIFAVVDLFYGSIGLHSVKLLVITLPALPKHWRRCLLIYYRPPIAVHSNIRAGTHFVSSTKSKVEQVYLL